MASAWILKTARGERAGFVQQAAGTLRAKARADGGGEASLVWGDGDGEIGQATLALDGAERAFPTAVGRSPEYAYVARDGRLLLLSGERAAAAFRAAQARREAGEGERERRTPHRRESASHEPSRREATPQPPRREAATPNEMPERRWPPPPAWPKARYVSGRWTGG